jgi:hypothetical protein
LALEQSAAPRLSRHRQQSRRLAGKQHSRHSHHSPADKQHCAPRTPWRIEGRIAIPQPFASKFSSRSLSVSWDARRFTAPMFRSGPLKRISRSVHFCSCGRITAHSRVKRLRSVIAIEVIFPRTGTASKSRLASHVQLHLERRPICSTERKIEC